MKHALFAMVMFLGLSASLVGADSKPRVVQVSVSDKGFDPASVNAEVGERIALVFTRKSDKGCGQEVVVKGQAKGQDVRHKLPLNKPLRIEVVAKGDGPIVFTCGMGMYKGSIVVGQ